MSCDKIWPHQNLSSLTIQIFALGTMYRLQSLPHKLKTPSYKWIAMHRILPWSVPGGNVPLKHNSTLGKRLLLLKLLCFVQLYQTLWTTKMTTFGKDATANVLFESIVFKIFRGVVLLESSSSTSKQWFSTILHGKFTSPAFSLRTLYLRAGYRSFWKTCHHILDIPNFLILILNAIKTLFQAVFIFLTVFCHVKIWTLPVCGIEELNCARGLYFSWISQSRCLGWEMWLLKKKSVPRRKLWHHVNPEVRHLAFRNTRSALQVID